MKFDFNPVQDGGQKAPPPVPLFPLQLLQMLELAPKTDVTFQGHS